MPAEQAYVWAAMIELFEYVRAPYRRIRDDDAPAVPRRHHRETPDVV